MRTVGVFLLLPCVGTTPKAPDTHTHLQPRLLFRCQPVILFFFPPRLFLDGSLDLCRPAYLLFFYKPRFFFFFCNAGLLFCCKAQLRFPGTPLLGISARLTNPA